jgi:hypothetical protein
MDLFIPFRDALAYGGVAGITFVVAFYCCSRTAMEFAESYRNAGRPEPTPPPKPREYRVVVEDVDGWPIRSFGLPAEKVGRLLREIERDKTK